MFTLPLGEEDSDVESYEGCPLVRLPDAAEEVEALLNALRDPLCVACFELPHIQTNQVSL